MSLLFAALLGALAVAAILPLAAWWTLLSTLAVLAAVDATRLRRLPSPSVARELPPVIVVGQERDVALRLRHAAGHDLRVEVHDLHPGDWPVQALPRSLTVAAGREVELSYRLLPPARGQFEFPGCALRLRSPWGLWTQRRLVDCRQSVRVYPNFAPWAKLALVGAEQASRVLGAHLRRRRGEGTEFHQLREYRTGDALRQIDWKASQRARKLISRDYQDERSQQVLLLLDCGRRLLARDAGLVHFDHVLNAGLMVAYIALRQGDAVGLMSTGVDPRFLAPQRGVATVDRLLNAVFDLHAKPVATDYLEAATRLARYQPRRALVLMLTNARDEDVDELAAAVRQMQKRHLVCVASLREQALDQLLQAPVPDLDAALRLTAAAQYLERRDRSHRALRAQGADVLDVTCNSLPTALVEHYLAVKRAGRL